MARRGGRQVVAALAAERCLRGLSSLSDFSEAMAFALQGHRKSGSVPHANLAFFLVHLAEPEFPVRASREECGQYLEMTRRLVTIGQLQPNLLERVQLAYARRFTDDAPQGAGPGSRTCPGGWGWPTGYPGATLPL